VNTQTFLGEDKCSEVGDGIEQSEDAELQPLLALLQPRTLARGRWWGIIGSGAGPRSEAIAPTPPPTPSPALRTASAAAGGCFLVVVVVLVTADRLTVLFTLLVGVVAAEVGVAAVANMADEATAAAGMMVNGVLGAAKN